MKGKLFAICHFRPYIAKGNKPTVDSYVVAMDFGIDLVGEELVGVGSDAIESHA